MGLWGKLKFVELIHFENRLNLFVFQRYRVENGGNTVKIALNVDSETQTLCRTDLNAEAYVTSNTGGGNIRQFTLTSKYHVAEHGFYRT